MNRRLLLQLAAALSLTVASLLAIAAAVRADEAGVAVEEAFARATIGQASSGVVYLRLVNRTTRIDRLTGASSPIAARADLHMTIRDGDIVRMRRMESVAIPPGEAVVFGPGASHIMLSGLEAPLREGDRISLTLELEAAGAVTVEVPVRSIAAGADTAGDGHAAH